MSRYFLEIEFNGAEFSGWQLQPDAKTVEGSIEDALATIFQESMDFAACELVKTSIPNSI